MNSCCKITKKLNISHDFSFYIEVKLCEMMSTVTFPWQHNGLQALSVQRVNFRVFFLQEVLFALVVHLVGVSEYGHYTAKVQESLLNSGARNKLDIFHFRMVEVW